MNQKSTIFQLNVDQVSKLNKLFPKGYKLITLQQNNKRIAQLKRKPKITYIPIQQIKYQIPSSSIGTGRRNKNNVSYYQGEQYTKNKNAQDYQPEKYTKVKKQQKQFVPKSKVVYSNNNYNQPNLSHSSSTPPPPPKVPLSVKQILQLFQKSPQFYVIQQYKNDYPSKCTYDQIFTKAQLLNYSLQQFITDKDQLFIQIYGNHPRSSNLYNHAAQLQSYLNVLINNQIAKIKEQKQKQNNMSNNFYNSNTNNLNNTLTYSSNINYNNPASAQYQQNPIIKQQPNLTIPTNLSRQASQTSQQQLLRKKTIMNKPDIKNITILDKRILGQNIKKLPTQCLPDICKIVYQTLQTRQQYIIDIDTLPLKKVKQLQAYVGTCMSKIENFQDGADLRNQGDSSQSSFIIQDDFD